MTIVLFSAAAVLILPFVRLYTAKVTDANYIAPLFAFLLVLAGATYCFRIPYHAVIIAAGHFRQTEKAAYGEAILNVTLSVLLVIRYELIGVAIGTLAATLFRFIYYAVYLSNHILNRKIRHFFKRECINLLCFASIFILGRQILVHLSIKNYWDWACCGIGIVAVAVAVTLAFNCIFYYADTATAFRQLYQQLRKN